MSYEYNAETKNILQDWINTLKKNNAIDELFVSRLEDSINLTEIGDSEKIRELIESLENRQ